MATLVEYTPKLQRAVDMVIAPLGIKELQAPHRSGRSTFTDRRGGGGGGGGEYTGYFKAEHIEKDDGKHVVRIYDGTCRWNDRYDTDIDYFKQQSAGICLVNNYPYYVKNFYKEYDSTPSGNIAHPLKYFLVFDATKIDSGNAVEIQEHFGESFEWFPEYDADKAYYPLAMWRYNDSVFVPMHTGGAPNLFWFKDCTDKDKGE